MNRIALTTVLAMSLIVVTGAFPQEVITMPDPEQPLIMVFANGEWKWIRGLQRRGSVFEYYELIGRHVKTERFVSVPVENVDLEAFGAVNMAFVRLGAACAEGKIREEDFVLDGRSAKIFDEVARATVFIAEDGRKLKGCYRELYLMRRQKRLDEQAERRTPQPTPTPWPTPTWEEIEAAQAEFREANAPKTPSTGGIKILDEYVDPFELSVGEYYLLSGEAPMVENPDPIDPMAAILQIKVISPGGLILIKRVVKDNHGHPWYQVSTLIDGEVEIGYVGCALLVGQDLKRVVKD